MVFPSRLFILSMSVVLIAGCGGGSSDSSPTDEPQKLAYPESATVSASNTYFDTTLQDPYQWMENTTSDATSAWVRAQNQFSKEYLSALPHYADINARVRQILGAPQGANRGAGAFGVDTQSYDQKTVKGKDGSYYYTINKKSETSRRPQQTPASVSVDNIIYVTSDLRQPGKVLLDLNQTNSNPDDHIQLTNHQLTDDNRYLVYQVIRNYSDVSEIQVVDMANISSPPIQVIGNANGGFTMHGNGFFYVTAGEVSDPYTSSYVPLSLRHRRINAPADDTALYQGDKLSSVFVGRIYGGHLYFSVGIGAGSRNEIYRQALSAPGQPPARFLGDGYQSNFEILNQGEDGRLRVKTSNGVAANRLISVDPERPEVSGWKNLLPIGASEVVEDIVACDRAHFAEILVDGASTLVRFDADGGRKDIALPGLGALDFMECRPAAADAEQLVYSFSSMAMPAQGFAYDSATGASVLRNTLRINGFDPAAYVMERKFVTSPDGARVPIFMAYKKGLVQNGANPAYIHVYGGFGVAEKPGFSEHVVPLLENGGIYVVAQVRGGGEYGKAWHEAGRAANKQITYHDVIAVADYLIRNQYTSAARLGLEGGSNGGLTTAAVALQRPDLFKAVFPMVGVLDLLRFQEFTMGFNWIEDYGSSSNEADFRRLLGISPLHNVRNVAYPAMLIMTGQTDGRVVPSHSYKFAATLQNRAGGTNPYLLTAFPKAGHSLVDNRERVSTDTWAFFFAQTKTAYRKPAN